MGVGKARKKTAEDYHELAKELDIKWLGEKVPGVINETTWRCSKGHEFRARYHALRRGRDKCPVCYVRYSTLRKTPEDYYAIASKHGFKWLGPEVSNTDEKTWWECGKGHQFTTNYTHIQQEHGCSTCYGNQPKIPEDYRVLAKKLGFRWLGPRVSNIKTKTWWECKEGHKWESPYHTLYLKKQGRGCPYCSGKAPKTPEDYHAIENERGFKWLGPEAKTTKIKTWWECKEGHKWEACYSDIKYARNGCPTCSGLLPKILRDYHTLARKRGFKWLGPEVPNTNTKTWWECKEGHKREATYGTIQSGCGCPFCSGFLKNKECYLELAKEKSIYWLGTKIPEKASIKTTWQCKCGFKWRASYTQTRTRLGCPICSKSKGEKKIARILSSWKIKFITQKRFDACKDKNPLPFDFYFQVGDKHFLIEYQGIQHFQAIEYFGGKKGLEELQVRDRIKSEFAKQYKYILIVIPYTEYDNIREILKNAIELNSGIQVDKIIMSHLLITKSYKFDPSKYTQSSFIDS